MRLTLRTLLAYLDDVLDPVDKEELAQKIESSDFAEDLVHRTRDTVRRLRLSAPQVIGAGMGLDPNTVAEYLDNVMPPEQVGDFERICLESDVHLAEATACHHVLTMILGEPADVDPIARQRMYTIANEANNRRQLRVEAAHVAPATAAAVAPTQSALPSSYVQPRSTEIPEYLRAGGWWRSTSAVIGLATVVLIGTAIVFATGLSGWFGSKPTLEPLSAQNTAPPLESTIANNSGDSVDASSPVAEPPESPSARYDVATPAPMGAPPQPMTPGIAPLNSQPTEPAANTVASNPEDRYAVPPASAAPPTADLAATAPPAGNEAASATSPLPPGGETGASSSALPSPAPPAAPGNGVAASAANNAALPEIPTLPGDPTLRSTPPQPPVSSPPIATPPANSVAAAAAPDSGAASVPPLAPPATEPSAKNTEAPAPVPDAGTYLGGKTVLLRQDEKTGDWYRVEPRAAVVPGERVLSLPEFRPTIALVSGIQVYLAGGTQVIIDGVDAAAGADTAPSLDVVYGRVVLINPTNSEKQIRLKLGPHTSVARLNHNTTLAVEVERKHVPGNDPRKTPAPGEVRVFAPEGGIGWSDMAGDREIAAPSRWTITDAGASDLAADSAPPEWIDHEPVGQVSEQRVGAPVVEATLVSNVPAADQLLALYKGESRREVKSLVARSSIHVGLFQPFIEALRDSDQKANWKTHIETLRAAMALSPEPANHVYQALVEKREKAAPDLYEMLCGYNAEQVGQTPEQIKAGPIARLINWLEDDSLDYRVLAVQDLSEITGKTLMPNPAAKLADRTQAVRRWRSRLDAGELKAVEQP
jgi:hypothetical protein